MNYLCEKCRQLEREKNPYVSIDVLITCNHENLQEKNDLAINEPMEAMQVSLDVKKSTLTLNHGNNASREEK